MCLFANGFAGWSGRVLRKVMRPKKRKHHQHGAKKSKYRLDNMIRSTKTIQNDCKPVRGPVTVGLIESGTVGPGDGRTPVMSHSVTW